MYIVYNKLIELVYSKNILLPRWYIQLDNNMFAIAIFDRLEVCVDTGNNNS